MERLSGGLRVSDRVARGRRRRVGVGDTLEVVEPVQIDVGLVVDSAVGDGAGNDLEIEALAGQVELEEARIGAGWVGVIWFSGENWLSGRQIALNPLPRQLPGRDARGPSCNAVVIGPR